MWCKKIDLDSKVSHKGLHEFEVSYQLIPHLWGIFVPNTCTMKRTCDPSSPLSAKPNALKAAISKRKTLRALASKGFTLIELMVVLVIIGVLAALIIPNVLERADEARVTAAKTDISNLMQALKLYKLDNQTYPSADQGLQALATKPTQGVPPTNWKSYVDKVPNDPWGHPYQYLAPGIKNEVDVMSFGADGQSGGEGKNADLGSWQ
jgi:general secretion pathway protein G